MSERKLHNFCSVAPNLMGPPPFTSFFQRLYLSHKLIELIHSRMYDISVKRVCTLGCAGLYHASFSSEAPLNFESSHLGLFVNRLRPTTITVLTSSLFDYVAPAIILYESPLISSQRYFNCWLGSTSWSAFKYQTDKS